MSNYRDLNKELVEQVQAMRKNMKLYCDEIIRLKEENMQRHESEAFLRRECYNWAVNSFMHLIQFVQPESEILPIIKERVKSQEKISSTLLSSNANTALWRSRTTGERRSSILTVELRRSNSVINIRKSVRSVSPSSGISRETDDENEEERQNSQSVQEENVEIVGNELEQTEIQSEHLQIPYIHNAIYEEIEEVDEEEDEEDQSHNLDVASLCESVEEVSDDDSSAASILKDVTNTIAATTESSETNVSQSNFVAKRGRPLKNKTINKSEKENTTGEHTPKKTNKDVNRDKKVTTKRLTDFSVMDIEEDTLQIPRGHINDRFISETNKSIPISQDNNHLNSEASLNSVVSMYTDMTLANFKDAACSTPNSRRNSLIKDKVSCINLKSTEDIESAVLSATANTSTRPSRQCKPKDLAEPKLHTKLRNESECKTKHRAKSKPKTRK